MQSLTRTKEQISSEALSTDNALRCFVGYRLKKAYNTIRGDLLKRLEPLGLRITTFSALVLIVDNPGLTQSELATALDIKRSNMVAIIDDLQGKGWVLRKESPADRRAFALYPTKAGQHACKKALNITAEHDDQVLSCLNPQETTLLLSLLEKIEHSEKPEQ